MRISVFNGAFDPVPKPLEVSWEDFVSGLGPHEFIPVPQGDVFSESAKRALKAFSPCEFKEGATNKHERLAVRVHFGVLDLDDLSTPDLGLVMQACQGLDHVFYTTWKHGKDVAKGRWRARVCVKLSRPVDAPQWRFFWPAMLARLRAPSDPKCKDPTRIYFGAFAPDGTQGSAEFYHFPGAPLDVDGIPIPEIAPAPEPTESIPRERLEAIARTWIRKQDPFRQTMGQALRQICRGEPFAEPGNRDTTLFQLAQDLAKELPRAIPRTIANHFAASLSLMGADAPSVDDVVAKLDRGQLEAAAEVNAALALQLDEQKTRIREAFADSQPGRDTPYAPSELESFARKVGCTSDEFRKRWLIQRGSQFYVWVNGKYSPPYGEVDVMHAIPRDLAPAITGGVELWHAPNGEPIRKSVMQLMGEYGTVAQNYVLDLRAQEASYDPYTRVFTEAPCPLRDITPAFNPDIDTWLRVLCGNDERYHDLKTWIALVTNLDEICAALMLTGAPSTGKSLLAKGLARLWTNTDPTELESAMSGFNDTLAHCPLVFADEQLPKDWRGFGRTGELRRFIAGTARAYRKKYAHETSILGAVRVIIAANNEDILSIQENLSNNDIEAIGDRFYHIQVADEAAEWLRIVDTGSWVDGNGIAAHALWLRDNHEFDRVGRFMVKGRDKGFYRSLSHRSGIRSAILQWLIGYLKDPRRIDMRQEWLVRVRAGRLLVNSQGILNNWDVYVKSEGQPPAGKLAQAVVGLSNGRMGCRLPNGRTMQYRQIDTEHLYAWADTTEFASRDEIDQALMTATEDRNRATTPVSVNRPN